MQSVLSRYLEPPREYMIVSLRIFVAVTLYSTKKKFELEKNANDFFEFFREPYLVRLLAWPRTCAHCFNKASSFRRPIDQVILVV